MKRAPLHSLISIAARNLLPTKEHNSQKEIAMAVPLSGGAGQLRSLALSLLM